MRPIDDLIGGQRPQGPSNFLSLPEEQESWNTTEAEAACCFTLVRVEFEEPGARLKAGRRSCKVGIRELTSGAPGRPHNYEHAVSRKRDMALEDLVVYL
jgi:hypothetical protein